MGVVYICSSMRILYNGDGERMKKRDRIGWEMLLRLLLEDIEGMERDDAEKDEDCPECGHSDGYLLDEIDKHFKGKATNAYGIEIDFDEIRKAKNMYDAENIDDE